MLYRYRLLITSDGFSTEETQWTHRLLSPKSVNNKSPKQNNALFLHNGTMRLTPQSETFFYWKSLYFGTLKSDLH